jgi:hypothetical protein
MRARTGRFERPFHDLVAVAHASSQAPRHFHQQVVAGSMAERVVDILETVEVDQQQRGVVTQPACMLECAFGAPDQLAPVGQPGQGVEVGEVTDAVFGHTAVGHVLEHAGVADTVPMLEFGLGLDVHHTLAAIEQRHRDVRGQHRVVGHDFVQHAHQAAPLCRADHAQQCAQFDSLVCRAAKDAQRFGAQPELAHASTAAPVEAAHAGQILGPRKLELAAFELESRARGTQHVAQAPGQQTPLRALDIEIRRAGPVGSRDRGVVVQARQHQHGYLCVARHCTQRAAGLETVHTRHQRVEHDHVWRAGAQRRKSGFAAGDLYDLETAIAQRDRSQHQVDFVVVDQQDARLFAAVVVAECRRRNHLPASTLAQRAKHMLAFGSQVIELRTQTVQRAIAQPALHVSAQGRQFQRADTGRR